ncbi:maestro heat-like repeat-containing protein family member 1 [Narcine bancroftii]|uniref:maestro heat-like repeat-containing protein family member 1 n=1 Tax=Narcine bancroftii TaxID=1343680 RepID=UPI00383140DB
MPHNVELFTAALVKMTIEEEESSLDKISHSLHILGQHHPNTVLMIYHDHLVQHLKLTASQGALLLESMGKILKDTLDQISQTLVQRILSLAALWMTKPTGTHTRSQEAASNLLVIMSFRFTDEVVQLLMETFKQGYQPHVYIVKTLTKVSTENPFCMVPFLKQIFGDMFPSLFGTKQEEMKAAFATALGSFSKSILMYLASVKKTSDPPVTTETFSTEINTIYCLLFKVWLEKEPPKLMITIAEALGYVSSLLPKERIEKELPKILPAIMSIYKKYPGHSSVTECLCHLLDIAMETKTLELETQMDNLLDNLHQQICLSLGSRNSPAVKIQTEILHCFTVLAPTYGDTLVDFLLPKLEKTNQQTRLGTLSVLRHLISSASLHLERKKAPIVAALKPVLLDTSSNQEKKLIAHVICALAQHGYLAPEEGKPMVEFLIHQCAASVDPGTLVPFNHQTDQVTDEDLATVCETVMFMITNTVMMEDVLWPLLLEFVTMTHYTKALTTICNCLAHLGKKKRQDGRERFPFTSNAGLNQPKAQELLARLFLLSSCPYEGGSRGAAVLRLLQVLSASIHPATVGQWDKELPALVDQLLENSRESLPEEEWEEKLLLLLSKTLKSINEEEWIIQLSEEMWKQIETECQSPRKGFLYKALGIVLSQIHSRNIKEELHQLLLNVQHSERVEREGAAFAFGFVSMTHFEDVLICLEEFSNSDQIKNVQCVFSIHQDKARSTLVLCYGNMALYAPEEQVLDRIESHILPSVLKFKPNRQGINAECSDRSLQLSLIKTITLIARSLHTKHQTMPFNRKWELLKYMQDLMEAEAAELLHSPARQMAMNACTHLIKLHADSNPKHISQLVRTCLASVVTVSPVERDSDKDGNNHVDPLHAQTMTDLKELLKLILIQDLSPECFQATLKQVEGWITSPKEHEREQAMDIMLELLRYYLEEVHDSDAMLLTDLGALIGQILPRCADSSHLVRRMAVDSIHISLAIQLSHQETNLDQQNKQLEILNTVREELVNPTPTILLQACWELAKVISRCMPQEQLSSLLFSLFHGLSDHQPNCSSAAALLTKATIKTLGRELNNSVSGILEALRVQLQSVSHRKHMKLSVLRSFAILASNNPTAVVECLLSYPAPFDEYISEVWKSLAEDIHGSPIIMRELLDTLKRQLHWEKGTYPSLKSLAGICALHEMIRTLKSAHVVTQLFPQLFSIFLIHLSCIVEISTPRVLVLDYQTRQKEFLIEPQTFQSKDMCAKCVQALIGLMNQTRNHQLLQCMKESGGWNQMMDPYKSHLGAILLAKEMIRYASPSLSGIVEHLTVVIPSVQECQKVTVIAFFSELLKSPLVSKLHLTDVLVSRLLQCLLNAFPVLQIFCVRGLGNMTLGDPQNIEKYSRQVLCAMIYLLESNQHGNEMLMFEVLSCLGKHLSLLQTNTLKPYLTKIFSGIQIFFEASNDRLRAEAINVFGNLAKCGTRDPKSYLCRQIHGNLVRLLLQLDAKSEEISQACNLTLHLLAPLVASAKVIENYTGGPMLNYMEFLRVISRQLMKDFPERIDSYITDCVSFFNNPEEQIRANAVTLSALFFQRPDKHAHSARKIT